jgi:molecular chaperone GrpE
MVSFRKEKKKVRMAENKETAHGRAGEQSEAEGIRVVDRRRINMDGETNPDVSKGGVADHPSLKPTYVEELEARTKAAEQKLHEVQSRFERLRSDLQRETDETRRRLHRAADERALRAKADFIASLLPVLDNLQRALDSAEQGSSFDAVLNGVRGTATSFENTLLAAGVEPLQAVGSKFDPERHDAVDTIEVEPEKDDIVTAEYSRGYKLGDRLLRPARVQVGRASGQTPEQTSGEQARIAAE